ncbi:Uncharacterised protein [Serratia ficaria]|nr:Uncharacterised protein [Serratia ficaria]CAI1084109.1 Uncharacterised protein [Serratia ficaria]CAI1597554.1 Uncharacterised protein [Serratia ficaria]CAI2399843.1 Uncharacterised protein [Serratia ficaria]CAI2494698.1 Uncharacterised protein [Serratia ficaria]
MPTWFTFVDLLTLRIISVGMRVTAVSLLASLMVSSLS